MDVQLATTPTVRLVPDDPMSAPTAVVYGSDGDQLATATPTPSAVDTTVAEHADSPQSFVVTSATGIVPGLTVRVTDDSWGEADAVVASIDETWLTLVSPLPGPPAAGSTVVGLDVTVPLPAGATDELGMAKRLEVVEGANRVALVINVVAHPYVGPCRARHVRAIVARKQPSHAATMSEQLCEQIAEEANADIRGRLLASRAFVSAYWDPDALRRLRAPVLGLLLGEEHGIWDANVDREVYVDRLERKIDKIVGELLHSAEPYDEDLDGELTETEAEGVSATRLDR